MCIVSTAVWNVQYRTLWPKTFYDDIQLRKNRFLPDILCDMGMIDQLVGHLSEEHSMFQEHVLSALLTVIRNHPRSLKECLRPELNLVSVLQERKQTLKGVEQYQVRSICTEKKSVLELKFDVKIY